MDGHLKYGLLMGLYSSALLAMPTTVLANTDTQNATDLPQIVSWDGGHGYLESGEMLRNDWGYDTVNPAGFTLFKNVADGGRTPAVHLFESLVFIHTLAVLGKVSGRNEDFFFFQLEIGRAHV